MKNTLIPGDENFMKEPLPIRLVNVFLASIDSLGPPRRDKGAV